jgi:hypothetical protein
MKAQQNKVCRGQQETLTYFLPPAPAFHFNLPQASFPVPHPIQQGVQEFSSLHMSIVKSQTTYTIYLIHFSMIVMMIHQGKYLSSILPIA